MTTLQLADRLALPGNEAVTQKYGFIGRSGSGKSYAAMKLAELFLGLGAQVIALDWVGLWWSLRLAAGGKAPGFEHVYIFGGEHADVPLEPTSGAMMADLIVDKHISVVLDVMHFRKAERTRFATAFAEQFFHRKKTARTACHLFLEEAQAYLPQLVRGDEARMVGVFEDIGKVGRNYGIGTSLISQRPQAINKDVLNQIEVLLAFQTNGPQERKAIAGWTAENTGAGAAMMQELPGLPVGDALVWSPQWLRVATRVHIAPRTTYDASSTPTQHVKAIAPKRLAQADLDAIAADVATTIEKAKADDPKVLRARIAELEKAALQNQRLASTTSGFSSRSEHAAGLTDADRELLGAMSARLTALPAEIGGAVTARTAHVLGLAVDQAVAGVAKIVASRTSEITALLEKRGLVRVVEKLERVSVEPQRHGVNDSVSNRSNVLGRPSTQIRSTTERQAPSTARTAGVAPSGDLAPAEARMHAVLASVHPASLDRTVLAIAAGYSVQGGGFRNVVSSLFTAGHLTKDGARLVATASPNGSRPLVPTADDVRDTWRAKLSPAEFRMLDALIAAGREGLTRPELAERTHYDAAGGGFRNTLSALSTNALVVKSGGRVAVHPVFLDGVA